MIPIRVSDVPAATLVHGEADGVVTHVTADSRLALPGSLFVCLPGAHCDGHDFIRDAARRGAVAALCARGRSRAPADLAILEDDDPLGALGELGRLLRERSRARLVAVAGSAGKTSAKDVLRALLAPQLEVVASEASFNNELGVPLTLARLGAATSVCVCELGTGAPGEIAGLCRICLPDAAMITAIGAEHLEFFGSVAEVAAEEAQVIAALPPGAPLVMPQHEPLLDPHRRSDLDEWRFGPSPEADVFPLQWQTSASLTDAVFAIRGERVALRTSLRHPHHRFTLAAAVAAYAALGLPLDELPEGAEQIVLSQWRGEEKTRAGGGLLINDAYNANPLSMRAALEALAARRSRARTVAVLGDMAELGTETRLWHASVGAHAARLGIDLLVAVGPLARGYLEGAVGRISCSWFPDVHAAGRTLPGLLEDGDVVLLKGSRCGRLELLAGPISGARLRVGRGYDRDAG